jgi:L-asparaginase
MALEQGHLGSLFAGQPYYFYEPARPTGKAYFDLNKVDGELPKVDILYSHHMSAKWQVREGNGC